ncbi:MAG: YkvA family protein [Prevotella sp.]
MENNNLPDFMKYTDDYSSEGFIDKISRIAKRAGAKLVYVALILYYTLQSNDVSVKDKAIIIGALGYLISPLDIIPDAIPIAGLGDDLAVLLYVVKKVWGEVPDSVREKAHAKLSKWFDEDEMKEADDIFSKKEE